MNRQIDPPLIVALDFDNRRDVSRLVSQLRPEHCRLKVGKELFTRCGPELVTELVDLDFRVFLDLKFHDIPNTTANAVAAAADLGVWMVNVHASGGRRMMEAAAARLQSMGVATKLTGVTVLTSMEEADLREIGVDASVESQVLRLATMARECGLDGVVCSGREAGFVRGACGEDFLRVTPGIRPAAAAANDQRRTMTPSEALAAGSTHLVIGRPVTASDDPGGALLAILEDIGDH